MQDLIDDVICTTSSDMKVGVRYGKGFHTIMHLIKLRLLAAAKFCKSFSWRWVRPAAFRIIRES